MPEMVTLNFSEDWLSLDKGPTRREFEEKILPAYLSRQRWFASKGADIKRAEMRSCFPFPSRDGGYLLASFRAHLNGDRFEDYFVPLAIEWRDPKSAPLTDAPDLLAEVHKDGSTGFIKEALADPRFAAELVRAAGADKTMVNNGCQLRFSHTAAYFGLEGDDEQKIKKLGAEQSNSSILIAGKMILKAYRRLEAGIQPELEMGRYLTSVAHYRNTPPLLASAEQFDESGLPTALIVIQGFVPNQGDGWSYTLNHLKQDFAGILEAKSGGSENLGYSALAEQLGVRIAELHRAFALESGDPAFQPEPTTPEDVEGWRRQIRSEAETTFGLLSNSEHMLPPEQQRRVLGLLDRKERVLDLIASFRLPPESALRKTRYHGDLHLGQVLVSGDDFYIIDFEGEPARPFAQRRAKHSPLKDVAGMLRSLNYAAWSALFEASGGEAGRMSALEQPAKQWEHDSAQAFMRGYKRAIEDCPSCPQDPETFPQLLNLFLLEKALYEVRYELANRPSWLRIPVEGILSLLQNS